MGEALNKNSTNFSNNIYNLLYRTHFHEIFTSKYICVCVRIYVYVRMYLSIYFTSNSITTKEVLGVSWYGLYYQMCILQLFTNKDQR